MGVPVPVGVTLPEGEFVTDAVADLVDVGVAVKAAEPVPEPVGVSVCDCDAVTVDDSDVLGVIELLPPTEIDSSAVAVDEGVTVLEGVGVFDGVVEGVGVPDLVAEPVDEPVRDGVLVCVGVIDSLNEFVVVAVTEGDAPALSVSVADDVMVVDLVLVVEAVPVDVFVLVGVPDGVFVPVGETVPVAVSDIDSVGDGVDDDVDDAVIDGDTPKLRVVDGVIVRVGERVIVDVSEGSSPESMKLGSSPNVGGSMMATETSAATLVNFRAVNTVGSVACTLSISFVKLLPLKSANVSSLPAARATELVNMKGVSDFIILVKMATTSTSMIIMIPATPRRRPAAPATPSASPSRRRLEVTEVNVLFTVTKAGKMLTMKTTDEAKAPSCAGEST